MHMIKLGIIGKNIDYSFSRVYFNEKFKKETIEGTYSNFDCKSPEEIKELFQKRKDCIGFNVTIPYKQTVVPFLDECCKYD